MKKITKLFVLIIFCSICAEATNKYHIRFLLKDSLGNAESFATIKIFKSGKTKKPIITNITDLNGFFVDSISSKGKYSLQITSVGKNPLNQDFSVENSGTTDLGTLTLHDNENLLSEIVVTAQKPLISTEIDRVKYDMQSDEDSKTNNLLEMLKKVPYVTVDGQDNIQVNGSSSFKIYKNGKPNTSWSNNPKDVLKSIPANIIKRVEVITEPGAKYDAEGLTGILNIVTIDNAVFKGVAGSVNAGASVKDSYNGSAYLTTQIGKYTGSFNYGFQNSGSKITKSEFSSENRYIQSGITEKSSGWNDYPGWFHYGNIDNSLEIDSLNLITFMFGGYYNDSKRNGYGINEMYDTENNLLNSWKYKNDDNKNSYYDLYGKLDYQHLTHRKNESLIFSYLVSTTNSDDESRTEYFDIINATHINRWQYRTGDMNFQEHTFQFDWTRPFGKGHKIETGAKYILRLNKSNTVTDYEKTEKVESIFHHDTQVAALYAEYSYNTLKWGARAGLRYEYSHLASKDKYKPQNNFSSDFNDFVPTLSLNYKINPSNNLKLNFATRINRPGIYYLNPAITKSPTSWNYGNPDLESSRRHSLSLNYSLMTPKIILNLTATGGYSDNMITSTIFVKDNIKHFTYDNIGSEKSIGASLYLKWQIARKTDFMINGHVGYADIRNNDTGLKNYGWNMYAYAIFNQILPWKIKLGLTGSLYKSGISDLYYRNGTLYADYSINLSRSFLKDDKLTFRISATNPIGNSKTRMEQNIINGDYTGTSVYRYNKQNVYFSVSFRFGELKAGVKKTNKTIENSDLQGGKSSK